MEPATAWPPEIEDLLDHLTRHTRLGRQEAAQVLEEVLAFFAETAPEFVARRHSELRRDGQFNAAIYARIAAELERRRFASPRLSERQIRRLIYG